MGIFQVANGDVVGSDHMNQAISQGIPRFADKATRDAAFAAIGGAEAGMRSYLITPGRNEVFRADGVWVAAPGEGYVDCYYGGFGLFAAGWQAAGFSSIGGPNTDMYSRDGSGRISFPYSGRYSFEGTWMWTSVTSTTVTWCLGNDTNYHETGRLVCVAEPVPVVSGCRHDIIGAATLFQTWVNCGQANEVQLNFDNSVVRITYVGPA